MCLNLGFKRVHSGCCTKNESQRDNQMLIMAVETKGEGVCAGGVVAIEVKKCTKDAKCPDFPHSLIHRGHQRQISYHFHALLPTLQDFLSE
jgi:hypothetical protein